MTIDNSQINYVNDIDDVECQTPIILTDDKRLKYYDYLLVFVLLIFIIFVLSIVGIFAKLINDNSNF